MCLQSAFFYSLKIYTFPQHVLFATDEVEFQEDGKFRLVCASRCSEEVFVGLDCNKKMPVVPVVHYGHLPQLFKYLYTVMLVLFYCISRILPFWSWCVDFIDQIA